MKTRRTRRDLAALADARGLIRKPGRKTATLRLWPDGSITRADIDLAIAKRLTVRAAFAALQP